MDIEVKSKYRLFRRQSGIYFCEDRQTGRQLSLRTTDQDEAIRLLSAHNEARENPAINLQIAKAYMVSADPELAKRTWRYVADQIIKTRHGPNAQRWQRAIKEKPIAKLLDLPVIQTRADDFLAALNHGTVSTNVYLRRLHNFALGYGWLLAPVIPPKFWPPVVHQPKRAITRTEHEKIIAREGNAERRAFYELLWELGGSQSDVACLTSEDIDWKRKTISYFRKKTGHPRQKYQDQCDNARLLRCTCLCRFRRSFLRTIILG
jgi:integrase